MPVSSRVYAGWPIIVLTVLLAVNLIACTLRRVLARPRREVDGEPSEDGDVIAREVAGELWAIYGLKVVSIPTHRPVQRRIGPTRMFRSGAQRWDAVAQRCREVVAAGRSVLVGTRSVAPATDP